MYLEEQQQKISKIISLYDNFYIFQKLSEAEHEHEGEHNTDYDHEAFLGKDEAKTFDQLTPDESRERLA